MCGIAGILNLDSAPTGEEVLRRMMAAIAHRGPDGDGVFADASCALGHRRLAIIDLSDAARQPMSDATGRYTLIYNGEIYNFTELRRELESSGQRFRSQSDAEVLVNAWAQWGSGSLGRLNGMFAFAVWDAREQTLTLVRDRYGVKPLYYAFAGTTLVFGSEVKAILACPTFRTALDKEGLLEYLTFQNFFTDRTLFRGVRLVPAGCYVVARAGRTGVSAPCRYWDFHFREESAAATQEEDYLEELDHLFQQAVRRQLVADVEIGAYLSGGLDSGAITAVAARQLPYIKSFTCGFDLSSASGLELAFDEREAAEWLSYRFRTEHYEVVLKAGDMERVMPRLAHHLEEPRVGQSYPNFYVAQLAGKFVKVVLAGTGGDELFGGYPWRYYRAVVNDDFENYVDKYYAFWQRLIPNTVLRAVCSPIWEDVKHVCTRDIFRDVFAKHASEFTRPEDYVNHSLYFEAKTFLHGLLVMEDKLSMAHGLETRVPFLDNDLVDFAMRLPVRMKLGNLAEVVRQDENEPGPKTSKYFARARDGKLLLRKLAERYVEKELSERPKQGFSAPDASWYKGESIDYVRRTIVNPSAKIFEILDRNAVALLVNEHLEGKHNRRLLIWSLLSLEAWCQAFRPF
jgi:asparagine synthase (glutamine-hydrolysing)